MKTVLYTEDDDNDAFFMEMAFESAGAPWKLVRLSDGNQAIDYLSGFGQYADRQ